MLHAPPAPSAPPGRPVSRDPESSARCLAAMRAAVERDYRGDCLAIAREIERLLRAEGRNPAVMTLVRQEACAGSVLHGPLTPLKYGGRVTWTRHYVCCCDGMAYDPILSAPVHVRDYPRALFGLDLPMTVTSPPNLYDAAPALRYADLRDGGRALAAHLAPEYADRDDTVVLALVRGGVKTAIEVANELRLPLDVVILRRLLLPAGPGTPPLCVFNLGGTRRMDDGLWREPSDPPQPIDHFLADALADFAEREAFCRGNQAPLEIEGKTVLLVDNGTRTGWTVRNAIRGIRTLRPARIVAALPLATEESRAGLEEVADEVVCLRWFTPLPNVAAGYLEYDIPRMEEVGPLMNEAWSAAAAR